MSGFVEQLRLAEKAAEDIYFAKVNRELIESLHKRMQAEKNSFQPSDRSSAEARAEDSPVVMKQAGGS
jgi:DNA replication initiation complex subunit (GINS family)